MEFRLKPETESLLKEQSALSGRAPEEIVEDVISGYLSDLAELRAELDRRCDEVKSGAVKPVDGEAFFESLRLREQELLSKRLKK
jgi:hypothetical protein